MATRQVTIVVHEDGALASRTWRIPLWTLRVVLSVVAVVVLLILLGASIYIPILTEAARVPFLVREVERLEAENDKIAELATALDAAERRYDRIRNMLGADIVRDPIAFASPLPVAPAIRARFPGEASTLASGPSEPNRWPLDDPGYVTRGLAAPGPGAEPHQGLDIAVPIGRPVRAAGGGTVLQAGEQAEYGRFVLLEHPGGYETMYGHLSRITVATGQPVDTRQVIGLSGNTGRSSAPHLHFEIRREGQLVNPNDMIKERN
jgi:murein DD-endopeptidase MepM/ murein hydrolase activator NlpD